MNTGHLLTNEMWKIAGKYLKIATDFSLYHVMCLMTPFYDQSDCFNGDIGHVKVVIEKETASSSASASSSSFSSPTRDGEGLKMRQMSEQVGNFF